MAQEEKKSLIAFELRFLEKKLKELKKYISDNPYGELTDRQAIQSEVETKSGPKITYKIVATKEVQRKDLSAALKDYAEILGIVDKLRTTEAKKKVPIRGDAELGRDAKAFLENRKA